MAGWFGSVDNRLDEGKQFGELEVGMGATEMMYSDRHAYTVQKIISPKRVIVTRDKATLKEGCTVTGTQKYDYESTPLEYYPKHCTHLLSYMCRKTDPKVCHGCTSEDGTCEGCKWFQETTNGIELRLCKHGWKRTGHEDYFTLGLREEYYDPSF